MRRQRNTKIVATLGPASSDPAMIARLFEAGADVFRLNFSHGGRDEHRQRHAAIRALEDATGRPIGILADLQGPKLRVGTLAGGTAHLLQGSHFRLDLSTVPGDRTRAPLPHPEIFAALAAGMRVLLDDGKIRLVVKEAGNDYADCMVVTGGTLTDRKGVNVPDAVLPLTSLTEKDRSDLEFAIGLGVDWVALSFVQRPDDLAEARKLVAGRAAVLAKIEKPAAVRRLDEIIELADALMVARGDLGVELPLEEVPGLQKRIIRAARRAGRPVIVATQMLESMVHAPSPTRAEVSDVATAVWDGTDAIMLSAESAAGEYPVDAVATMSRIAERIESEPLYRGIMDAEHANPEPTSADAITAAARQVAETINAAAIVTYTTSGSTALRAARERPRVPVLCLTPSLDTARRLTIAWGVHCVPNIDATNFGDMVEKAGRTAMTEGFAEKGQRIVITAGVPFGTPGATNILRLAWVDPDGRRR
ncbi:MAG TPA: pyruvate kinase [Candidatus Cybelea sp.]|nr:pyruvate kinase [Candidatus Cybelea sp.]